jgi:dihydrofolate reductase
MINIRHQCRQSSRLQQQLLIVFILVAFTVVIISKKSNNVTVYAAFFVQVPVSTTRSTTTKTRTTVPTKLALADRKRKQKRQQQKQNTIAMSSSSTSPDVMHSDDSNGNNKIQGYVLMGLSVDGFIAGPNGELDWLNDQPPPDPTIDGNDFEDFLESVNCMVMGRTTFDVVVTFGPEMWLYKQLPIKVWTRDPNNVVIPDYLRRQSDGDSDVNSIGNVEARTAKSPQHLFDELQKEGYRKVYVDGGRTVRDFLNARLITRLTLSRVPILIGKGISLFDTSNDDGDDDNGGTMTHRSLKHVATKVLSNGIVQTTYDVVYDDDDAKGE